MKMEDVKKCIICGQEGVVLYDGLNDRYSLTDMLFTIKRCPSCGMLWLDPRVAAEDMAENCAMPCGNGFYAVITGTGISMAVTTGAG